MKKAIPYIVIAVLLVALLFSMFNRRERIVENITRDTVEHVRIDTVREKEPFFVTERIVDTVYVEVGTDSAAKLPITQKYYSSDDYKAWVSGYEPRLDSIHTFGKVVTRTITNTETMTLYQKTTDVFLEAGCNYIGERFSPFVGASLKLKNGILLGGSVGLHDKSVYYGVKIGLKLNKDE